MYTILSSCNASKRVIPKFSAPGPQKTAQELVEEQIVESTHNKGEFVEATLEQDGKHDFQTRQVFDEAKDDTSQNREAKVVKKHYNSTINDSLYKLVFSIHNSRVNEVKNVLDRIEQSTFDYSAEDNADKVASFICATVSFIYNKRKIES